MSKSCLNLIANSQTVVERRPTVLQRHPKQFSDHFSTQRVEKSGRARNML